MSLVQTGIFTRPLYHGTTSLFFDSIEKNGLGGRNPLVELRAYDTFAVLYKLAETALDKDEFWQKGGANGRSPREMLLPFAKQSYEGQNFSFKHG